MHHLLRGALAAGLLTFSSTALADGFIRGAPRGKVEWNEQAWHRFTPAEGALTTMVIVGSMTLERRLPDPIEPNMNFEVPLLDPGVRGLLRARSPEAQEVWVKWGDIGYRSIALFPYVVDVGAIALGVHRNADVAGQMALINLQSFTLAAFTQQLTSRLTSRPRPFVQDCADDGRSTRHTCGDLRDVRSFFGGHAAAAFTAAGLTCVHHRNMPLWGGGAPDAWACVWALSYASLTAVARITSDEHWASDTLVGIGAGWFYGYLLPTWLHYGTSTSRPRSIVGKLLMPTVSRDGTMMVAPTFLPSSTGDGGMVGVRGTL